MKTFVVAAFTRRIHTGNPAGVCLLERPLPDRLLQLIAKELGQPETAFVGPFDGQWPIRWFSPLVEVELCGHATLAAAHVLWREGLAAEGQAIAFASPAAVLSASRSEDLIWLDFPALPGVAEPAPDAVLACVQGTPRATARHHDRWLLEYATVAEVRALAPDFAGLRATGIRSLIATAPSDTEGFDIVSRNFAPIVGIDEDQVTGMAHTCLAPHWRDRLGDELRCWQASPRGGSLRTRLKGNRVALGGDAVIERAGVRSETGRASEGGASRAPAAAEDV